MDAVMEKPSSSSRSVLFGFLLSCLFSEDAKGRCPLSRLRNSLTTEEKYDYVMQLSQKEVDRFLNQHAQCFTKRILAAMHSQ